ncbi:malate:quinone oxidoreductase, partial [Mycobacterium sp.]|uniref:malate:quinone oxidoreductase n=1 Tax=Mycobacterium sp. TaxID=1785 RepID=UPI003F81831D
SPGASTAVPIMLGVLERCFANRFASWQPTLKEMVPSLGATLSDEPALYDEVFSWGTKVLGLGDEEERRQ